jgi:hypothetical protein
MSMQHKRWATLSLAAALVFAGAGCSRHKQDKPAGPAPSTVTQAVQTPIATPQVEEEAPEPEQTEPPISFAPAADYARAVTAALQKAGYTGRESVNVTAELERRDQAAAKAAEAGADDPTADLPDPATTAKAGFGELGKLRDVYVWTTAPHNDDTSDGGKAWTQQIAILGNISVTQPAEKDEEGKTTTPETRYGNMLVISVSVPDEAKGNSDIFITVEQGWGYTDGRALTQDNDLRGLSERQVQSLQGSVAGTDDGTQAATTSFTWGQRQQALGLLADWLRDNSAPKTKPAQVPAPPQ